jgi:hypothetical protein
MIARSHRPTLAAVAPFALAFLALLAAGPVSAQVVTFDSVAAAPGGTIYAGNTFSASGVFFYSVNSPNALAVGQIITLSNLDARLLVLGNANAISNPNFAAATGVFATGGPNDVLMRFTSPVTSVRIATDDTPAETPNLVRLIGLRHVGGLNFLVTAIDSGSDAATFAPFNVLSLDLTGKATNFVLFQTINEAEGFDNLRWVNQSDCTHTGPIVSPGCFQVPDLSDWVPVGCEIVDCCPFCPGPLEFIDWVINVAGDPFDLLTLKFADLSPEAAAKVTVEGSASWNAERQTLEIKGGGRVLVRGLPAERGLRATAAAPRMTLERLDAPESTGAPRALRVQVHQQVNGQEISNSTLVYKY